MLPLHHQCASRDMTVMVFSPNAKGIHLVGFYLFLSSVGSWFLLFVEVRFVMCTTPPCNSNRQLVV